jgi:hypothetical protein
VGELKMKKSFLVSVSTIILLGVLLFFLIPKDQQELHINYIEGNHAIYDGVEDLEAYADIIVVGQSKTDFIEDQHVVEKSQEGFIRDYYTITNFTINKNIKGDYDSRIIKILQPASVLDEGDEKVIIASDGYSLIQRNNKYMLFLKRSTLDNVYSIVAISQGKHNIDKKDKEEQEIDEHDNQLKKLKIAVKKKYEEEFEL